MTDEKVIDRVRKLLRLARDKGATENEAANALAAAQALMLRHNITTVEEGKEVHAIIQDDWIELGRSDKWERMIATSVAKLFNCRNMFKADGRLGHKFVGKPDNIEVCREVFPWVCKQVDTLYKQGLRSFRTEFGSLSKATRGEFRQTFKEGCALRIAHRVNDIIAQSRNQIPEHMALVVIDQSIAAANDLMKDIKIKKNRDIRKGFGSGAGYLAGDAIKLQRDLPQTNGEKVS